MKQSLCDVSVRVIQFTHKGSALALYRNKQAPSRDNYFKSVIAVIEHLHYICNSREYVTYKMSIVLAN